MYANLFEHETIRNREQFNRIADATPMPGTPSEWEAEVIRRAVAAGIDREEIEGYLLGDPSC